MNELLRKGFEQWAEPRGFIIESYQGHEGEWFFSDDDTQLNFECWQASRESLVIELPSTESIATDEGVGFNRGLYHCRDAIKSLGLKVKP